jgi:hypothetical protein
MAWYSGWYNGLARKHYWDWVKSTETEHLVIEYCKTHRDIRIIDALAVQMNDERMSLGINMQ